MKAILRQMIFDQTLKMLATEPAAKLAALLRRKELARFLEAQYLPKNWQETEPDQMAPDSPEAAQFAQDSETTRQAAETKWNALTKEQQEQMIEQLTTLDPARVNPEEFRLLDQVTDDPELATLRL